MSHAARPPSRAIAITGMACRFPGADNLSEFWTLLATGKDVIRPIPDDRWNAQALYSNNPDEMGKINALEGGFLDRLSDFDAAFFELSPRKATFASPEQRLLYEVTYHALEQAGQVETIRHSDAGVFLGIHDQSTDYAKLLYSDPEKVSIHTGLGVAHSAAGGRLAHWLDLHGPCLVIDTACSSGLAALHAAHNSLLLGDCETAIVGAVNVVLLPHFHMALARMHMLAPDSRCKAFDHRANGYVRSEGAAALVLKPLDIAQKNGDRILAVIRGTAINQDGRTKGITAPSPLAQQRVIEKALERAQLFPNDIDFIEAHGTGTTVGDLGEIQGLKAVFGQRERPLYLGAVKTNIGHLESVSGLAGVIKTVLAMQHDAIPPNLHLVQPNPALDLAHSPFVLPEKSTAWPTTAVVKRAGVSSFGWTGVNTHVVLESFTAPSPQSSPTRPLQLLPLSAKSDYSLQQLAAAYAQEDADSTATFAEIAYSAAVGRSHFSQRRAIVATDWASLHSQLRTPHKAEKSRCKTIAWVFTGQGSQYASMGETLYHHEPFFRDTFDALADAFLPPLNADLRDILWGTQTVRLHDTAFAQPAIFALEVALARLWTHWGMTPTHLAGHSIGELAAAHVAGVFDLTAAAQLITARGQLMQNAPGQGGMAACRATETALTSALAAFPDVVIAAHNHSHQYTVAGPISQIDAFCEFSTTLGLSVQKLAVSHAFHSPLMTPILDAFREVATQIAYAPPQYPLISSVTGQRHTHFDADYWVNQIRQPVNWAAVAAQLTHDIILEIGPHPVLMGLMEAPQSLKLASLRRGQSDYASLLNSLARYYEAGGSVHWPNFYRNHAQNLVDLPLYPFERKRFWVDQHSAHDIVAYRQAAPTTKSTGRAPEAYSFRWQQLTPKPIRSPQAILLTGDATLSAQLTDHFNREFTASSNQPLPTFRYVSPHESWESALMSLPVPREIWLLAPQTPQEVLTSLQRAITHQTTLSVVTRNAVTVHGEKIENNQGAIWGLAQGFALEHPTNWGRLVDWEGQSVGALLNALMTDDSEDQIALRNGQRHGLRLQNKILSPNRWQPDPAATYLISGGLGGVGLRLATHLAQRGARHLVLINRRSPTSSQRQALEIIEKTSCRVECHAADIADLNQIAPLLADLPYLRGIFHLAATATPCPFHQLSADDLQTVLRPKAAGAYVLHQLTAHRPLEVFVMFSSMAAAWGATHLAHYSAANRALDALAEMRHQQGLPALAVDWGAFDLAGLADTRTLDEAQRAGLPPLDPEAALNALEAAIADGTPRIVLAAVNWSRFAPLYRARRARPLLDDIAPEVTPAEKMTSFADAPQKIANYLDLVTRLIAELLNLPATEVEVDKGFFEAGMDSLMAVELKERLAHALGTPFPATLAFDYPDARRLAAFLEQHLKPLPASPPATPEEFHSSPQDLESELAALEALLEVR